MPQARRLSRRLAIASLTGFAYAAAALVSAWIFHGASLFNRGVATLADRPLALSAVAFLIGAGVGVVATARHDPAASSNWRDAFATVSFAGAAAFLPRIELARLALNAAALAFAAAVTVPLLAALFSLGQRIGRRRPDDDAAA